ncbi:MAG TPA: DUF1559 domain-containing protein [Isosphaeraceae bacterium]|jgi:prepilin-type processing-associated H-X9-DG protein|nr:DUF1559 domain-containing protein [Isosphaeraceae bacterium]
MFGYDRSTQLSEITDGTASTMSVIETTSGGPWTAGGPSTIRGLDPSRKPYIGPGRPFSSPHRGGVNVLFADGSVHFIRQSVNPQVFEAMATIAGGEVLTLNPWDAQVP